jgi:hypothetical protein
MFGQGAYEMAWVITQKRRPSRMGDTYFFASCEFDSEQAALEFMEYLKEHFPDEKFRLLEEE